MRGSRRAVGTNQILLAVFAVASLVPLFTFGIVLEAAINRHTGARSLTAGASVQRAHLEAAVWDAIPPANVAGPLSEADRAALDATVPVAFGTEQVVGARLVDLSGEVLWSTGPDGRQATAPVDLVEPEAALVGSAVDERTDLIRYRLPLRSEEGEPLAVIEATVDSPDALTAATRGSGAIRWLLVVGFIALWLFLVPLASWVLDRIWGETEGVRRTAMTDPLTGLANRTTLEERGTDWISNAVRHDTTVALAVIDLNGFKQVNDTGGHQLGDTVLVEVGRRLLESTRRGELAVRLGGDEFAVLAPQVSNRAEAEGLAARIRRRLDIPVRFADHADVRVSASVGVALAPDDALTLAELIEAADRHMYAEKNRFRIPLREGMVRARLQRRRELPFESPSQG